VKLYTSSFYMSSWPGGLPVTFFLLKLDTAVFVKMNMFKCFFKEFSINTAV